MSNNSVVSNVAANVVVLDGSTQGTKVIDSATASQFVTTPRTTPSAPLPKPKGRRSARPAPVLCPARPGRAGRIRSGEFRGLPGFLQDDEAVLAGQEVADADDGHNGPFDDLQHS
ncbi:hypothetical protein [Nonomuraea polychroma]|uniref:hypothetical protein n=1 Tax=Nonomuraea polychroma TaxID=46176 RepID=UPI003BA9377C